jgi:hypothetical protein
LVDKRTIVDFLKKFVSRKLLVLILATILLILGKITGEIWLYLSVAYMGTNVLQAMFDPVAKKLAVQSVAKKLTEEIKEEGST